MSPPTAECGSCTKAGTLEEIKPLVDLCRAGKLFAVQQWIAEGKPINLLPLPRRSSHARSPLDVSIERGFHSLVEVLLNAGAEFDLDDWNGSMAKALKAKRFDLIRLLVEHGYDAKSIDMKQVFVTWDPELMEYFIDQGADVEKGNPLAFAFCQRIQTALRIFKKYRDRFPSFPEQANIALRWHCKEGNLKWVSLLLWAGADPYAEGVSQPDEKPEQYSGASAIAFAVLYRHFDILKLKQVKLDPSNPATLDVLRYASEGEGIKILQQLLEKGLKPNDQENGGCSQIQYLVARREFTWHSLHCRDRAEKIDCERAREKMKAIHVLAKHGARWVPKDKDDIKHARRELTRLTPDYTLEFAWIMGKYGACEKKCIEDLVATPTMKRHLAKHWGRLREILDGWPVYRTH